MKFNIKLSPVRSDISMPYIFKMGTTITIDNQDFDFGFLNDGDVLPNSAVASNTICSDVTRVGDTIELTIRLPHGPDAPEYVRFPQPILVEQDGPITLPGETNAN